MRRGQKKRVSLVSHTPLSFFPTTYRLLYLCLSCVLGNGWKRLDFDKCTNITVMSSKATKGDQNSQSLNENKTGNIIHYRIKHQSQGS